MNGKRPVFADDSAARLLLPDLHIRFLEIPPDAMAGSDLAWTCRSHRGRDQLDRGTIGDGPELDEDLEIDEDFLRRVREA